MPATCTSGRCPCPRRRHVPAKRPGPSGHGGSRTSLAVPQILDEGRLSDRLAAAGPQQPGLRMQAADLTRAREPRSDPPWAHNDPSGRLASATSLAANPTISAARRAIIKRLPHRWQSRSRPPRQRRGRILCIAIARVTFRLCRVECAIGWLATRRDAGT